MTIARAYAAYCAGLTFDDLPEPVVEHAKKLVADIVANALGGYTWMASGSTFVEAAGRLGDGRAEATLLATGDRLAPGAAALANGALAHSLDYDNHHAEGVVHIGSSVVPAALAAAEADGATGAEFLTAVAAGYEVTARLGLALNPFRSHTLGFHPTGTCGTFGATAAVGVIRDYDPDAFEAAFGLNGSQAAGSMQYDVNGAWNKRSHPGLAANAAFVAAALVEAGFVGAHAPIEGEDGFLQAYSSDPRPDRALRALGEASELRRTAIKPYPLCRYTHLALDLLLDLAGEPAVTPDAVERIAVELPAYGVNLVGRPIEAKRSPTSSVDAQFSLPFAAALALTRGEAGMRAFRDAVDAGGNYDATFQHLMDVTTVETSEAIEAKHPEQWPARVTLVTAEAEYERYGERTKGEPGEPLAWAEVARKFAELTPGVDDRDRQACMAAVRELEHADIDAFVAAVPTAAAGPE